MKTLFTFLFSFVFIIASAQETWWMRPDQFRYEFGDTCKIFFQKGEQLIGEHVSIKKEDIGNVKLMVNGKTEDLTNVLYSNEKSGVSFPLRVSGTYQVVWEYSVDRMFPSLEAYKKYLEEQELEISTTLEERSYEVRETIFNVLMIQVGNRINTEFPTGQMPLEIIPLENPYSKSVGGSINFQIRNLNEPVFSARVGVLNRFNRLTTLQRVYTEKSGNIRVNLSSPGPWMVHVSTVDSNENGGPKSITRVNLLFGVKQN
jgi:hypothetical protein